MKKERKQEISRCQILEPAHARAMLARCTPWRNSKGLGSSL